MSKTSITLLRHGLPEGDECLRGRTDFALTEQGFSQMKAALNGAPVFDQLLTSPLKRCCDFAQDYARNNALDCRVEPLWQELDFGLWDGKTIAELWQTEQQALSAFWQHPWENTPPEGETLTAFSERIEKAWNATLNLFHGKQVLVVTHAGVMRELLRQLLELPKNTAHIERINLPYASTITVTIYRDEQGKDWPQIQWPSPAG